jgi:hypothetical protein
MVVIFSVSCSYEKENKEVNGRDNSLVGMWEHYDNDDVASSSFFIFNINGTGEYYFCIDDKIYNANKFEWYTNENSFCLEYYECNGEECESLSCREYKIKEGKLISNITYSRTDELPSFINNESSL